MRRVFRLPNLTLKSYQRILEMFLFMTVVLAIANPALAQSGANYALENNENSIFPENNLGRSMFCIRSPEENAVLSDEQLQGELTTLCGIIPETTDGIGQIITGFKGPDIGAALVNSDAGDNTLLQSMLLDNRGSSLLKITDNATATIINQRPASASQYLDNKIYAITHFGEVKAQSGDPGLYYPGTGFDLLRPVQAFWGWSVNIVYGILILIIIFIAFGIMFRSSLSGGAVVTLQNAIPNIALAMILVPLSYAITGLLIDGITIGANVTHQFLLGPGAPGRDFYNNEHADFEGLAIPKNWQEDRGFHIDDARVSWIYASSYIGLRDELDAGATGVLTIFGITDGIAQLGIFDLNIAGIIGTLVNIVLGIILLLTGFRIFVLLFKKFVVFIIGPIIAPFVFATIAIPGQGSKAIMNYLKFVGSGTLYFIVAYAMTLVSIVISSTYFQNRLTSGSSTSFVPPMTALENIFGGGLPGSGTPQTDMTVFFAGLIALGIYLLIPQTLKSIDTQLGVDTGVPKFVKDAWQSRADSLGVGRELLKQTGQGANTLTRSITGRNLNGANGWATSAYRNRANDLRSKVSAMKESQNALTRIAGRTVGSLATAGLTAAEKTVGGGGEGVKTRQGFKEGDAGGGEGETLKVSYTYNGQPITAGPYPMGTTWIIGKVLELYRKDMSTLVSGDPFSGNYHMVQVKGYGIKIETDKWQLPATLDSAVINSAEQVSRGVRTSNMTVAKAQSNLLGRRIASAQGFSYSRDPVGFRNLGGATEVVPHSFQEGATWFGVDGLTVGSGLSSDGTAFVRLAVDDNGNKRFSPTQISTSSDRKSADVDLRLEFYLSDKKLIDMKNSGDNYITPFFGRYNGAIRDFEVDKDTIFKKAQSLDGWREVMKITEHESNVFRIQFIMSGQ